MPNIIKLVTALLLLSAGVAATGTYLDMELLSPGGSYDPSIYTMDLVWIAVISWVAWNLSIKKRDIRLTLILVGLIIISSEIWNYIEFGFSNSNYAYGLEFIIYLAMLALLNRPQAKAWYSTKTS